MREIAYTTFGRNALFIGLISHVAVSASEKPEIFVQMGHRGNVGSIVFSQDLF